MEDKIKKLEEWVNNNYSPYKCGWTDGIESGVSYAAYEIGCILGMDLEEPEEPSYN